MYSHLVAGSEWCRISAKIKRRQSKAAARRRKDLTVSSKDLHLSDEIYCMTTRDQRKHPRVPTSNLISFKLYDDNGKLLNQSMARALNISQSGILIETAHLITTERISLMSAGARDELVKIKGCVVYSRENGIGMYETGISFEGSEKENVAFAKKLVKVFHHRKNASPVAVNP